MAGDGNEAVRDEQERKRQLPFDAETDPAPAGIDGGLDVVPGPGGYAGRDPRSEMPRVPSVPETQDDPGTHDAAPSVDKPRPAHG
jgi:hypothetical protein